MGIRREKPAEGLSRQLDAIRYHRRPGIYIYDSETVNRWSRNIFGFKENVITR